MIHDTDLACERRRADSDVPGISVRTESEGEITWERIRVTSEAGAASVGRPIGEYDTMSAENLFLMDEESLNAARRTLSQTLVGMSRRKCNTVPTRLLVIGLGNRALTADAIGPRTADKIRATSHIRAADESLFSSLGCAEIAVIAPGVSAQSGLDVADIAAGIVERFSPDLVVAIDALAARSTERLGRTVQISDTGIHPGSGVGNHRGAITEETLGVPVIAIGVPTVTDGHVFFFEEARRRGIPEGQSAPEETPTFVSPKEIDEIVDASAALIAGAINDAFGLS